MVVVNRRRKAFCPRRTQEKKISLRTTFSIDRVARINVVFSCNRREMQNDHERRD
jgi:hypothetical protein